MTRRFRRSGWAALLPAFLLFMVAADFVRGQAPLPARAPDLIGQEAREEEEQDPNIRTLMGLTRFRPDSKEMGLAKQLLAFRNSAGSDADSLAFFKKMAGLDAAMTDVIRLQKELRERAVDNPALKEAFFGKSFPQGGSEVEKALLTFRRKVTMDGIDHVVKAFKGRLPAGKASVWLAEVGKWAGQDPRAMTFAGDIDFSFVSNDMDLTMEMKRAFEAYIQRVTGLDTIAFDSVCTAHGRAGPEVYITHAGQSYGQDQFEKGALKRVDLAAGRVDDQPRPGGVAILNMTIEAEISGKPGVIVPPKYNKEPGLSMEMVRHFNHDIVHAGLFDTVDSILKASKYVDRSMAEWKGKDPAILADAGLVDMARDITAAVQKTPDWLRVTELLKAHFGDALHYTVGREGKRPVTRLSANQRIIQDYFRDCNKLLWGNVMNGLQERLDQIRKRGAELESEGAARRPQDVKAYWDELRDLKDMVETERLAMNKNGLEVPDDCRKLCDDLLKAIDASCAKLNLRAITPEMLKQKAFIEEMIRARTPMLRNVAIVTILEGSVKAIEKGNMVLDYVDDMLLGELRGQNKSFDDFVSEAAKLNAERAKGADAAALSGRLAGMKNAAVQGIQAANIKANEVLQATSTRRGLMKGFMGANLAMEVSAYQNAWQQDGYSGLAAELLRRRMPGVSSLEAASNGNYGRALVDLVYIIFPPAALPEGIIGMGEALYGVSRESWWSAELELFTDTLYEWAEFSTNTAAGPATYRLEFLRYEGRPYMRADLDKGTSRFFEDPVFSLTLSNNLAATDAFLGYCVEGQKHKASEFIVRLHFREKARQRWDTIKRDYVQRMIARLEQRRASEKTIETGEIHALFTELQKTARDLRIEEPLFAAMDKEWDSGVLAQWWSLLKSGKRTALGQSPSEAEMTRAATVVRSYVEAYREVLEARRKSERLADAAYEKAGLARPGRWEGDGMKLRWLSGTPLLACKPKEDVVRARKWVERCSGAFDQTLKLLNAEREKEVPGAIPDPEFDARMAAPHMADLLWTEAYREAVALPLFIKQNALEQRQESQRKRLEEFLAYYRERARPVVVQVFQLIDGKRTEVPVNTAIVQGRSDQMPGAILAFSPAAAPAGSYVASGLLPGDYAVTVSAAGYRSEQGTAAAEGVLALAPGREPPPPLRVWLEAEKGTGPLSAEIRMNPEEGRVSNGAKSANVAVLTAFVTAPADSGDLHMEWLTGNEELARGAGCREARFVAHGRPAGTYRITLFVRDAKGRTAVAEKLVEVTPADGFAVIFAPHRAEIGDGEGELIRIESPKGDDWSYRWTLHDGTERPPSEMDSGTEWMADYRHFPGKTVTVKVKARNKRGEEAEGVTTIVMREGPPASRFEITGLSEARLGDLVPFMAKWREGGAGENAGKPIAVEWSIVDGKGKLMLPTTSSTIYIPDAVGVHVLAAKLAGGPAGAPEEVRHTLTVRIRNPIPYLSVIGPRSMFLGDSATLTSTEKQKDGIRLEWSDGLGSGDRVVFKPAKVGPHRIRCTGYFQSEGKEVVGNEAFIDIEVVNPDNLRIVIEPAEVRVGQSFKAVLKGGGAKTRVSRWYVEGTGDAELLCATSTVDECEAILQLLGEADIHTRIPSGRIRIGCRAYVEGLETNLVSGPITLAPLPGQGKAADGAGGPWLRLPYNWHFPPDKPVSGHYDFGIRIRCFEADARRMPARGALSRPMTVMGYKGLLFPSKSGGVGGKDGGFALGDEDAEPADGAGPPAVEYDPGEELGSFIGIKDKACLLIYVTCLDYTRKSDAPILNEGALVEPCRQLFKKIDGPFEAYLAGLPAEGALTLNQAGVPVVTIQPKPALPWRKGDKPSLTATLTGAPAGVGGVSFMWEDAVTGEGDTVWPVLGKPGKFTATAVARGAIGEIARTNFSWAISEVELKIDPAVLPAAQVVGDKVVLTAVFDLPPEKEGLWLKWESDRDVRFEGGGELKKKVTATFTKPGPTRLWVTLYRQTGATHAFLGEAELGEVAVGLPKLALTAVPEKPYVDQTVTVTLNDVPRLPDDLVRVNWSSSDNVREAGPAADERSYAFRPKDANPVTVSAGVLCQENGEELGGPTLVIQPRVYELKVSEPQLQGPAPQVWDPGKGRLVEVPRGLGAGQRATVTATIEPAPQKEGVRYRWSCTPAGATVAEAGGREATVSASRPGTFTLTVTALDADGVTLGVGKGTFTVGGDPETAAAPDGKAAEVERHYQTALKRWGEGELIVAIEDLKLGLAVDPKHPGCLREMERMTRERTAIEKAMATGEAHQLARRYESAGKAAEDALALNGQYAPARRLKELAQALNRGRDEVIVKTLREAELARKACEFARAIQELDGPALTYAEIPAEALGQIAALRTDCVARQAELERRKGVLNTARTAYRLKDGLEVERLLAGALDRKEEYFGAADQWHVQQMEALRAMAAEEQRRREQAGAIWQEAVDLQRRERLVEAEVKMAESLAADPDKTPANDHAWMVLSMANEAWRTAQDHAAKGELEEAIGQMTLSLKGARSAEREKALEEMKRRLQKKKADQQWGWALDLLGGDLKAAAAQGSRSLELDPDPPRERAKLVREWSEAARLWDEGKAHADQKRYAEALVSCEASVNLAPTPDHVEFLASIRKIVADLQLKKTQPGAAGALAVPVPRIAGTWAAFVRGKETARCSIIQNGTELEFVIERVPPVKSKGRFLDAATVVALDWKGLKATVRDNGTRLDWGASDWVRPGQMPPASRMPAPSTPPPAAPKTGAVTVPAPIPPPVAKPAATPPSTGKPAAAPPPVAKPAAPPAAPAVVKPATVPEPSKAWPAGKWKLSSMFDGKMMPCGQAEFLPGGQFTQTLLIPNLGIETQHSGQWTWNGKTLTLATEQSRMRTLNQPWQAMGKDEIETIRGAVDNREGDTRFRLYWTDEDDEPVVLWYAR